jgi:hypothetical protein
MTGTVVICPSSFVNKPKRIEGPWWSFITIDERNKVAPAASGWLFIESGDLFVLKPTEKENIRQRDEAPCKAL